MFCFHKIFSGFILPMKKGRLVVIVFSIMSVGLVAILFSKREPSSLEKRPLQSDRLVPITNYDRPCPELELLSVGGLRINLAEWAGEIITIRFSDFHYQDLPYLIYLDHLNSRLQNKTHLIFIRELRRGEVRQERSIDFLKAPVVEDDGHLAGLFNANLNDLFIVGRDFQIKFKYNQASNSAIFQQISRWLDEPNESLKVNRDILEEAISKIKIKDIKSGLEISLNSIVSGKTALINVATSSCYACPEINRYRLLDEIARKTEASKVPVVVLFSARNPDEFLSQFMEKYGIAEHFTVGKIVDESIGMISNDIYNYELDSMLIILNKKGKIVFYEDVINTNKINAEYILGIL